MHNFIKSKLNLFSLATLFTLQIQANTNWIGTTEPEYIENLVACQTQIKKLQWKNALWPKENKKQKFDFIDVFIKLNYVNK